MWNSALFPWIAFHGGLFLFLGLDQLVFRGGKGPMSLRAALASSLGWVVLSLACGAAIWAGRGPAAGVQFLTGYLVEYSLSADNVFIFVLIFAYFQVAPNLQPRVLTWGVLGAMVLRGAMIGAGALLLARFHWILYLFGIFLLVTGLRMLFQRDRKTEIESNPVVRFCRAILPIARQAQGGRFFAREEGRLCLTPLGLVVIVVECVDLLFAVDSVPAVFAITQDAFIVYSSNICAILGLRSLYFLLAGAVPHLRYLKTGLAVILTFIGAKMLAAPFLVITNGWSLAIVAGVLAIAVAASRWWPGAKVAPGPA